MGLMIELQSILTLTVGGNGNEKAANGVLAICSGRPCCNLSHSNRKIQHKMLRLCTNNSSICYTGS